MSDIPSYEPPTQPYQAAIPEPPAPAPQPPYAAPQPPAPAPQPPFPAPQQPLAYPGGEAAPAPAAASPLPGPLARLSGPTLLWIQVVGGVLAFIATFLPWATVSFDGVAGLAGLGAQSSSGNGFDKSAGMATLILLLGLIIAGLAFVTVRKIPLGTITVPWFVAPAAGVLLFLFSLIEWISTLSDVSDVKKSLGGSVLGVDLGVHASSGFGIWLLILASLVTLAATVVQTLPQIMALAGRKPAA